MRRGQALFTGAVLIVLLGCAFTWPHKTYTVALGESIEGSTLRGAKPEDDLPLEECRKTGNCYVHLRETFRAIVKERNDLKTRLEYCEKWGCGCRE